MRLGVAEMAAEAAETEAQVLSRLEEFVGVERPERPLDMDRVLPRPQSMEESLLVAGRVRQSIDDNKRVLACAVCSCFVGRASVEEESCPVQDLPSLHLLAADLPPTPELPRHGITHLRHDSVKYCLSPDGVTSPPGAPVTLRVPRACWESLSRTKQPAVPPRSLVRVDTGPWAADQHGALPAPTYVESLLLSSVIPSRKVLVMRPTGGGGAGFGVQKKELTGHVVVLPCTNVERLDSLLLPRSLDDLPELLTVSGAACRGLCCVA